MLSKSLVKLTSGFVSATTEYNIEYTILISIISSRDHRYADLLIQLEVMRITCLLILALIHCGSILAQKEQSFAIKIVVSDNNKVSLGGATVWLYNAQDTTNVRQRVTDNDGSTKFSSLSTGSYYFRIDALGFDRYTSLPLSGDGKKRDLLHQVILTKSGLEQFSRGSDYRKETIRGARARQNHYQCRINAGVSRIQCT